MASIYVRGKTYWIRRKDCTGKWVSQSSGYRTDAIGGKRQAQLAARRATQAEQIVVAALDSTNDEFASWVFGWLELKYANHDATTYDRYCRNWRRLEEFLTEQKITRPRQVTYAIVSGYLGWRLQRKGSRNTGLYELRLLGANCKNTWRRDRPGRCQRQYFQVADRSRYAHTASS